MSRNDRPSPGPGVRYYVYHLIDPRDDSVFYVGKGQRTRGNDHLKEAVSPAKGSQHPKDLRIREILGAGEDVHVEVVERFSLEADALDYERDEIARIGLENLTNILSGYESSKARIDRMNADTGSLIVKQEFFCQRYIEMGNASEAYRQSYNAENMNNDSIRVEANRLLNNPNVALRVNELQELHRLRHEVTVDTITRELIEDRQFAREQGQASAAISATVHKAKLHGLMAEKTEVTGAGGGPIVTEDRSLVESARRIAFVLSKAAKDTQ